jgi:hypothetical protein
MLANDKPLDSDVCAVAFTFGAPALRAVVAAELEADAVETGVVVDISSQLFHVSMFVMLLLVPFSSVVS